MPNHTRKPFKEEPLRQAGQSLDERIQNLIDEKILFYLTCTVFAFVIAAMEWLRWYRETPPTPFFATFLLVLIAGFSAYKIFKAREKLKHLKLGRDGEKKVGQLLEDSKPEGYKVFHDIVAEGFNIDHLVICKRGIFIIETKARSKPMGSPEAILEGETVFINGRPDRKIVPQVKAQARWLNDFLLKRTGKSFSIQPIVVLVGWFIDKSDHKEIWLLNEKAIFSFIQKRPEQLKSEDVALLVDRIGFYNK